MGEVCRGSKHQGASPIDHVDRMPPAIGGGGFGYAPRNRATVHPDMVDPEVDTLTHRGIRSVGPSPDHHRIHASGHRLEVMIAGVIFNLVCIRVDGEHLVSTGAESSIDEVCTVPLVGARDSSDRYATVGQKLRGSVLDLLHGHAPVAGPFHQTTRGSGGHNDHRGESLPVGFGWHRKPKQLGLGQGYQSHATRLGKREQSGESQANRWEILPTHGRLVVSEPLGELAGLWNEVPESSWGVIQEGSDELHPFSPVQGRSDSKPLSS